MVVSLPLLISVAPALAQEPAAAVHPDTAQAFGALVDATEIQRSRMPGLEIWCDDVASFDALARPAEGAWNLAKDLLGRPPLPADLVARVVVLQGEERLQRYLPALAAEAQRLRVPQPPADFAAAAARNGSGLWTNPPTLLVNGTLLRGDVLATRVVHDLGAVAAMYAACPWGGPPPEFFKEGFAGMLVRRGLKRPAAIVSHSGAALASTVQGYGVFAGLGAAANDASNDPANWPGILRTAVRQMRREKKLPPESMLDRLLLRGAAEWARTDYAYAWAAVEFLLDASAPLRPPPEEGERREGGQDIPPGKSRRALTLEVLGELRGSEHAALDAAGRAATFRGLLLGMGGETPEQLHAAFMTWVETAMPRK